MPGMPAATMWNGASSASGSTIGVSKGCTLAAKMRTRKALRPRVDKATNPEELGSGRTTSPLVLELDAEQDCRVETKAKAMKVFMVVAIREEASTCRMVPCAASQWRRGCADGCERFFAGLARPCRQIAGKFRQVAKG